ncbi:65-kDa microtubule-associated protein 5 isoform X2 [Triticum aestivum]|uniref:65-kDa microtubule-associated protein 5 isoform X2 n=1 Tax=Triticum aestivum TaxID=4565 RepID=UPI001D01A7A1|nr:65-kDa microtubule-associated protein 5-like isoform X2 [Triticum aestivum]
MCNMMSLDLKKTLYEVHPSFVELERIKSMSLQDLGGTLIELWSLTDTPLDEQKCFDHVTSLISVSQNTVMPQGCLAHDLIKKVEVEVKRLKHSKASKMKELVLKKMIDLEEIYRSVHMYIDSDHECDIWLNWRS